MANEFFDREKPVLTYKETNVKVITIENPFNEFSLDFRVITHPATIQTFLRNLQL